MRNLILLCTASFFSFAVPAQSPEDLKLVRAAVESFVNDFNNGGFPNASTYATTDWIHINPIGGMTRGRENVLKEVRESHQGMLKGVSITTDTMIVRFIASEVAIVNAIHSIDTYTTPDGMKHENEKQMKTYVVIRRNDKWALTLDQNTIIQER